MSAAPEKPVTSKDRETFVLAEIEAETRRQQLESSGAAEAGWANWQRLAREAANPQAMSTDRCPWVNAAKIEEHVFTVPEFAVPSLIPSGLSILAGRPKIGKSWLALHIADAISRGTKVLGNIEVEQGP